MIDLFTQGDLVGFAKVGEDDYTATCECGFVEPVTETGDYSVVPTGLYRFEIDAEQSVITQVLQYRYICPACFAKLPEE
jgi:hypothetical protein